MPNAEETPMVMAGFLVLAGMDWNAAYKMYASEIWDKWFKETIGYNPSSGYATYYINDIPVVNSYLGTLSGSGWTLAIYANASTKGWLTARKEGHRQMKVTSFRGYARKYRGIIVMTGGIYE